MARKRLYANTKGFATPKDLRVRGWPDEVISELMPQPDATADDIFGLSSMSESYRRSRRFYCLKRVAKIEKQAAFREAMARHEARRAARQAKADGREAREEAAIKKRESAIRKREAAIRRFGSLAMRFEIPLIPQDELIELATGTPDLTPDDPDVALRCVVYLRDQRTDFSERHRASLLYRDALHWNVLMAIATAYPWLAETSRSMATRYADLGL